MRAFPALAERVGRQRVLRLQVLLNTTNGALPPSSIEVRKTPWDACCSNRCPTGVEPVNDSLRRRGSRMMGSDTAPDEVVVSTFTTPTHRAPRGEPDHIHLVDASATVLKPTFMLDESGVLDVRAAFR